MIYVDICGRLGNQMFQYSVARKLQLKLNQEIAIGYHTVAKDNLGGLSLSDFNISHYKDLGDQINMLARYTSFKQKIVLYPYFLRYKTLKNYEQVRLFQIRLQPLLNKMGVCWMNKGYYDLDINELKKHNDIFVKGNYENPRYFDDIKNILLKEFTPKFDPIKKNSYLYRIINQDNSVCISIRRGDFFSNKKNAKYFSVYQNDYFYRGMDIISSKVGNPKFIVFSDDIEWVKQNMHFSYDIVYEEGNDPVWEKLRMMYLCKHFIISNSTFSWWAQYLSRNPSKIVVSPKKWINDAFQSELIDTKWILL